MDLKRFDKDNNDAYCIITAKIQVERKSLNG